MRRTSHLWSFAFFRSKLLRPRVMSLGYDVGGGGVSPPYYSFRGVSLSFFHHWPRPTANSLPTPSGWHILQMQYFSRMFLLAAHTE
jgi:hypothetical protein